MSITYRGGITGSGSDVILLRSDAALWPSVATRALP